MSMFSKLNQVKDMRQQAKKLQNQLSAESATAEHKGIRLTMDGNQKITQLSLPNDLLSPNKKNDLEKYLIECFEQATKKVQKIMVNKMKSSGIKMPEF